MKNKILILFLWGILLMGALMATSCTATTTTTTTSTITVPETTYTQIVDPANVKGFIAGIESAYSQEGAEPKLNGILESEFLSLTVQSESVISINGTSYSYVALSPMTSTAWNLPAEVALNKYRIEFTLPKVVTTGGTPISVQVFNNTSTGVMSGTSFVYYYIPFVINTAPVYVEMHSVGDLKFLFMYYYPSSSSQIEDDMWIILQASS